MNYNEFLEYLKDNIVKVLNDRENSDEYVATLNKYHKNNGIVLDGINIRKKDEKISPNIYLNQYYESYQMGMPLRSIIDSIISQYQTARNEEDFAVADFFDFEEIKNQIIIRLVNYEKNSEQLENCPHIKYLDLAVTFRYIANENPVSIASALITNKEFNIWNVSLETLYQIALTNTTKKFPCKINSLSQLVFDMMKNSPANSDDLTEEMLQEIEPEKAMYVLSNEMGMNGATCILYDTVVKNFADSHDCNVFRLRVFLFLY